MKKRLITTLCGMWALIAFAQSNNTPPRHVRESFQKEYPQSQPTQWHHTNNGWNADFEDRDHNNGEVTAHFDVNGKYFDTHVLFENNDVPVTVRDRVHSQYPGSENNEYTRINRYDQSNVYQVKVRHHNKYRTVYMNDRGHEVQYHDRHYDRHY